MHVFIPTFFLYLFKKGSAFFIIVSSSIKHVSIPFLFFLLTHIALICSKVISFSQFGHLLFDCPFWLLPFTTALLLPVSIFLGAAFSSTSITSESMLCPAYSTALGDDFYPNKLSQNPFFFSGFTSSSSARKLNFFFSVSSFPFLASSVAK